MGVGSVLPEQHEGTLRGGPSSKESQGKFPEKEKWLLGRYPLHQGFRGRERRGLCVPEERRGGLGATGMSLA